MPSHSESAAAPRVHLFSRLQEDILRVVLYFDIFRYPLRADEAYKFLGSNSTSPAEIAAACSTYPLNTIVDQNNGYFFVAQSHEASRFLPLRLENQQRAKSYLSIARFFAGLIRTFPFVRAVFVSGELSKGVSTRDGDIDFFIITAANRLWISRTLLTAFKKIFLLNSKKFFCLNHFITEDYLEVTQRDLYTALEIATMSPLHNHELYRAYRTKNSWVNEFFPNLTDSPFKENTGASPSLLQSLLESPFKGRIGNALDLKLMEVWKRIWVRRYSGIPKEKRDILFRCERTISTAYAGDFRSKIFKEYRVRLKKFGLDAHLSDE